MFLATPSEWGTATPPIYLVAGDKAVVLLDTQTQQSFTRVGVPVVSMTAAMLDWVAERLDPAIEHPINAFSTVSSDPIVDGGAPNSVFFGFRHDGGAPDSGYDGPIVDGDLQ